MDESQAVKIITEVRASRKYRELDLPESMLRQILADQAAKGGSTAEINAAFRKKLHNIVAPYLEEIDYPAETKRMFTFFEANPSPEQEKQWAASVMARHASHAKGSPI